MTAFHVDKSKPHGNNVWTRARVEAILAELKEGAKRKDVCAKHGINAKYFGVKLEQYNAGELQ